MSSVVRGAHATGVTHLVNCLGIGGTERQLVELVRSLDSERFVSRVLCLQKVGELLPELCALGLEPEEFHLRGTLARPNTLVQAARMARRIRSQGSGLLHAHDFYSNLLGSVAARLAGVPVIVSRRDLGAWVGPLRAKALAAATRAADHVVCNAWAVRDRLVDVEGIAPSRITVVHNGLNVARFDARAEQEPGSGLEPLHTGNFRIAVVANMKHPVKGHEDLLTAAALVVAKHPGARFLLLGDGALRPALEARTRQLGLEHAILFGGRRTDVPAVLRRCDALACPSHSEGLSNAVMEAMAAQLPVVATAVGGNVELVREGRSGFLVPRSDPDAMAKALLELAGDEVLRRRMGETARRRLETEFSSPELARRTGALYERMLGKGKVVQRAA